MNPSLFVSAGGLPSQEKNPRNAVGPDRSSISRWVCVAVVALGQICLLAAPPEKPPTDQATNSVHWSDLRPEVGHAGSFGESLELVKLSPGQPYVAPEGDGQGKMIPVHYFRRSPKAQGAPSQRDPVIQDFAPTPNTPGPTASFEGINNLDGYTPPDTVGAIGPSNYVQAVNVRVQVFNRFTGAAQTSANAISALFTALGNGSLCATTDDGDPVVLYDQYADRWLVAQFANASSATGPYYMSIAISKTSDPTGAYYAYCFQMPNASGGKFPDYPKIGVWPDGYYMAVNQFNGAGTSFLGAGVYAFERAKMLVGDASAKFIYFNVNNIDSTIYSLLPASVDGPLPPLGTSNYFACLRGNSLGDSSDDLRLFNFHADFVNTNLSSFIERTESPVAVAAYTAFSPNTAGVPQPGTSVLLDTLADRLMFRLQYRNYGSNESLVVTHTATGGSGQAAIRYYQLKRNLPGGTFGINEQATYAPDAVHRWMGSAAMNYRGDLAVGYSVSASSSVYPGIRYAARLASDPAGGLFQGEATLINGGGSQTSTGNRWGDYSCMTVDPTDDCTFWYTQEYYATTSIGGWRTRIGSFSLPGCSAAPQAKIQGTVFSGFTGLPLSNAVVRTASGYFRVTGADGTYSITLTPGTNDFTAQSVGVGTNLLNGLILTNGETRVQNFVLGPTVPILSITSAAGFSPAGQTGGPFSPTNQSFVVNNVGASNLNWTATKSAAWLTLSPGAGTLASGTSTNVLVSLNATANSLPAGTYLDTIGFTNLNTGDGNTTRAVSLTVTNPMPVVVSNAWSLVAESCVTNNGLLDPGETVTLNVSLKNVGSANTTNLVATLQSGGSVNSPSAPQSYGALIAGGVGASQPFTFTVGGSCGGTIFATFQLQDGTASLGTVTFALHIGAAGGTSASGANPATITINDNSTATPYPSIINIAGMTGNVTNVTVTLSNLVHTYPDDIDVLLVGPAGQSVVLMSDVGGSADISGVTLTFSDAAANSLPDASTLTSGTYKPTNIGAGDPFAAPASTNSLGTTLAVFNGKNPNGTWSLYVVDDSAVDAGTLGGWSINIAGDPPACCAGPTPPFVQTQPTNQSAFIGDNVTFAVSAGGTAPLTYQWRTNGVPIAGATTNTFTRTGVTTNDALGYTVVISNSLDSVTSSVATLTVLLPLPVITAQPQSQTALLGAPVNFSVTATAPAGGLPLNYQWRSNSIPIPGATATNYFIASAQLSSAATYSVVVGNAYGSATSSNATLTVSTGYSGVLAGWDMNAVTSYGVSPMSPTTNAPNVTVTPLTRGPGVTTSGTAAARAWGGNGFNSANAASAISAGDYATLGIAGNAGYYVSFSAVSTYNYRRSTSGPTNGVLQYAIGAGAFADIVTLNYSSSSGSGVALPAIDLSGIAALQSVGAGTNVTFRIVNSGATTTNGNWYIFDVGSTTAPDFAISGTVTTVAGNPSPAAPLLTTVLLNGSQFQFTLTGTAGSNYIVQVSTNLATGDWSPVRTNAAPFSFIESNASSFSQRFYRGLVAP